MKNRSNISTEEGALIIRHVVDFRPLELRFSAKSEFQEAILRYSRRV
jgi:hypothetical protein